MQNLFKDLEQLLLQCDDYSIDGKLNKPKIEEQALSLAPQLLKILLSHAGLKKHFFQDVDSLLVFDKVKFQKFISNKQFLPDSYTQFKNKIGLTANGTYLTESKEVVLDFPYKDCVLQGCQDKEDSKRNEVFFNETLAPDDIDMLLEPKALTNFKKYDATGEHKVTDLNTQDNLIIKGNNLLALHSLLSVYRGKVKLIYIDPPYNTGNDGFGYNDKFNHSTWLTFMKNRLEVARKLLREDGVIFIQCDDNEQAYLKVLMDELFKQDNFELTMFVQVRFSNKTLNEDMNYQKLCESIHVYRKSPEFKVNKESIEYELSKFCYKIIEKNTGTIQKIGGKDVIIFKPDEYEIIKVSPNLDGLKETWATGSLANQGGTAAEFLKLYLEERKSIDGLGVLYKVIGMGENGDGLGYRYITGPKRESATKGKFYTGIPLEYKNMNEKTKTIPISNFIDLKEDTTNCRQEGGVSFNSGKKPEILLKKIIEMSTNEGDIVLDYHLGSGTTAAVAHKMSRQYIGIEQMNYIEDLAITRLKNVIGKVDGSKGFIESYKDFDSSGISKAINWQGGGSFVYCELKQNNQFWAYKVINAISSDELLNIWQTMQNKSQLSYKIDVKTINATVDDFKLLSLEEQKQFLLEVIDKNQLYVNYTEIDDVDYQCSEEEKNLNNIFYGLK